MLVGQPTARFLKVLAEVPHHQINRTAAGPTNEATIRVLADLKRKAWVAVVVKRAQSLVVLHRKSESLRDPLNR